jgi:Fe-S-cluster containining protein
VKVQGTCDAPLPEPRSHSGCPTCVTARCCVVFDPEVTGHDLVRLMSLGLQPEDVADLRPTRLDQAGADALLGPDGCAWDLRLKPHKSDAAPPDGYAAPGEDPRRCSLLMPLPQAARCGVYAVRPMACRLFPSAMTSLGVFVATPEAICPPHAFAQERADLPTLTILHRLAATEREAFRFFAAGWNHQEKSRRALDTLMSRLVVYTLALSQHSQKAALALALEGPS